MTRPLFWLSLLGLTCALSSSSPPDLYAFPKYRIEMTRDFVSNASASDLLATAANQMEAQERQGYELMRTASGQAFLCKIPTASPDEHEGPRQASEHEQASTSGPTAQALTPQERRNQRQINLQAGMERGLALLESLKGVCLYQRHGWFTYSFCYGKSVRQFHEIRTQRGPQEDPNTHSYVLGQYPAAAAESPDSEHLQDSQRTSHIQPGAVEVVHTNTQVGLGSSGLSDVLSAESDIELEEDSDSGKRYLVQHWTGGTSCDMTGLERRVEVQFHCNTQSNDRIALIRETAICQYVLVIHTPRLCGEPLFLAAGASANKPVGIIDCKPVVEDPSKHSIAATAASDKERHQEQPEPAAAQALPEELASHAKVELKHEADENVVIIFDDETGQVLARSQMTDDDEEELALARQDLGDVTDADAQILQDLAKAVQRSLQALNVEDDEGVDGQTDEERLASVVRALFGESGQDKAPRQDRSPSTFDPKQDSQANGHFDSSNVGSHKHRDLRARYAELFHDESDEDGQGGRRPKSQHRHPLRARDEL